MNFRRKRIIFTPFLLLVLLLLSFQVSVVTGVPGDDPTTAIPISLGDTTGTMPGPGFFDEIYYIISLAGDYQFSITGPDGTDFDLYIISSLPDYFQMGKATGSDYPDIVTLLDLPADDYYVRVDTESGSGSFTLNIAEFVPTPISLGDTVDSLPGSYTDGSIWYNISLAAGDYHFSLTGPDGTDFNLDLFDKATTWPYKGLSTIGRTNGTVYPDIVTVLGLGVGLYYIQVYNVTGTGSFTLNIATGEDPTNARPINLGEFVGNLPGPAVDDSIWYVITLAAGDYQFNLTGLEGTNFDLELFDGEVTLIGGAHDVDYPDIYRGLNLMTDTYYIKVYAVLGTGSFTLNIAEFVPIPIGLGDTVGPITAPDESIWYNISLAAGDYQFSLSGPEGTNFDLFLYNSNLGYISTSVNPEYPDIYRGYSLIVDNYFIEIYASNGTGTFTLTVSEYTRVLNIISPVQQSYATNTIPVHFDGNAIHYWYFIEGIDAQNQTWTASTDRIIPDGSYTLHAYGNDTFNTILHVPVTFSVDTTPPVINIISPLNLTYTDQIITISYTVSDGEVTIFLPPNNTPNNTNIPSGYTTPFPDGLNYNITIEAVDHVGNIARSTVIFSVGAEPPSISIDSPLVTTYTDSIAITLSGSVDYFWYYIEGIDTSNKTWTITTIRSLPSGTYTLHAYGNNSVGVEVSESVTFIVDLPTTTTTTTTIPETTTTTTTKPKSGTFPSLFLILLVGIPLIIHKRKRERS